MGIPRTKLQSHRYEVVSGPTGQLEEAGGIKKDGEGVRLHAGKGEVAL